MSVNFGSFRIRFVPIATWPGPPTRSRQSSPFRAGWGSTLELLEKELRALQAKDVLLQTFHTENQLRHDGLPYANARTPDNPGVILTFNSKHGPLSFPCDTYRSWQDNIRAIALAMEALRKVDRYGVTKSDEQYRGWKALPGSGGTSNTLTAEEAARIVADLAYRVGGGPHAYAAAERILRDPAELRARYREAARGAHPDAGGSTEEFQRLQLAKSILEEHHGSKE